MAYYEVGQGENSNRIDLFFDEKPDDEILEELKSTGWRWYGYNRCWYTYDSEKHREQAERFCQMVNNNELDDEVDWFEYNLIREYYFECLYEYGQRLSTSNEEKIRSLAKTNASKVSQYYSGKKYYVDSILKDIKKKNAVVIDMGNKNYEIYFCDEVVIFTRSEKTSSYMLTDKRGKLRTLIHSSLEKEFLEALKSNSRYYSINKNNIEIYDEKYEEAKEEFLNLLEERNFYFEDEVIVKQNCFYCENSEHHIDDYCGIINVLNRKTEIEKFKIWVGYCNECEEYFIMKDNFLDIKQKGVLLCNLISESSGSHISFDNAEYLNDESILKQYGYHVGKNSDLTEKQRRTILALLLDSNIVSKVKIISLLNYFISMRENSKNDYSQAISDWESDIRFVSNYKLVEKNQILLKVIRSKW